MNKMIKTMLEAAGIFNKSLEALNFEMVKTDKGDEINLGSREVGGTVTKGEGENVANGEYTLEDGFKFTVKDGLIDSIQSEIEVKEVPVEEELADEKVPADVPVDDKQKEIDTLKEKIAELEAKLTELSVDFKSDKYVTKEDFNSLQAVFTSLNDNVKLLAKIPMEYSKVSQTFKEKSQKEINQEKLREAWRK